jgi:hypothetical protein
MDIKRKTCYILTWKKHLFLDISSTNIDTLVPSLYQCFETRSTEVFRLSSKLLPHLVGHRPRLSNVLERISRPSYEPIFATNTSHRKHEIFIYEYPLHQSFCPQKTHKKILLFCSTLLKLGHHFHYWNQPLNIRMRICYLAYHEAGLCCHLVIHIGNLLLPLQIFYFHLRPIYWLFFVFYLYYINSIIYGVLVLSYIFFFWSERMHPSVLLLKHISANINFLITFSIVHNSFWSSKRLINLYSCILRNEWLFKDLIHNL